MKTIPLTQGRFAIVDDETYDELSKCKWAFHKSGTKCYAMRYVKDKCIYMHRHLLNPSSKELVDHIDGDGLNNQKANLRVCSRSQNGMNQSKTSLKRSSRFKGVSFARHRNKWEAYIQYGKKVNLGLFKKEEDAALAYNAAALEYYGEFALLNRLNADGVKNAIKECSM